MQFLALSFDGIIGAANTFGMPHLASSASLGLAIAEAIGLPTENLVGFSLRFQAEQCVRCDAEYLVDNKAGAAMKEIIGKSFTLTER